MEVRAVRVLNARSAFKYTSWSVPTDREGDALCGRPVREPFIHAHSLPERRPADVLGHGSAGVPLSGVFGEGTRGGPPRDPGLARLLPTAGGAGGAAGGPAGALPGCHGD